MPRTPMEIKYPAKKYFCSFLFWKHGCQSIKFSILIFFAVINFSTVFAQEEEESVEENDTIKIENDSLYTNRLEFSKDELNNILLVAADRGYLKVAAKAIKLGADVNQQTGDGISPVMFAAQNGDSAMVSFLLEKGANPNLVPYNGITALIGAVNNNHLNTAEQLIKKGAKINATDDGRISSLMYASAYGYYDLCDMLIFYGAKMDLKDNEGNDALLIAVTAGRIDIADLLLHYGANANTTDNRGYTPLMVAAQYGFNDLVELLLSYHASINLKNMKGASALTYAIANKQKETIKLLLSNQADPNLVSHSWLNPILLAKQQKDTAILKLLKAYKAKPNMRPYFDKINFSTETFFNPDNFALGLNAGLHESVHNFTLNAGIDFRPGTKFIWIPQNDSVIFQYREKRYYYHFDIQKYFRLKKFNANDKLSTFVGIKEIYSWGNYRGSKMNPRSVYQTVPQIGLYFEHKNLGLKLNYEYLNLGIYHTSSSYLNLSMGISLLKHKKGLLPKQINWLNR